MDESSALKVVAMRAVETTDTARTLWTDEERAWASRAAAEVVGADGAPEAFLRRATLAIEKLGVRQPALPRVVRALQWRSWVGIVVVGGAFALGIVLDRVDPTQRINILAPPVLGLLIWNLAVYVAIVVGMLRAMVTARSSDRCGALTRIAGGLAAASRVGGLREACRLVDDWTPIRVLVRDSRRAHLHMPAAAPAAGVIAGSHLRGLALGTRAGRHALDASIVRSIVAFAYAPGALLTGIAVPGVDAVAAMRAPGSENAARWLHLMAATVAAVVVVPRLMLALLAGLVEHRRSRRFALPFEEPYFQRLCALSRRACGVIPYSYTPPLRPSRDSRPSSEGRSVAARQ
jgi:hypothetical protein